MPRWSPVRKRRDRTWQRFLTCYSRSGKGGAAWGSSSKHARTLIRLPKRLASLNDALPPSFPYYRGHVVNTVRESVFQAVYFGVYEHIKSQAMVYLPAKIAVPIAGGLSGAAGWLTSYPLDCIRTNIQVWCPKYGAPKISRRGLGVGPPHCLVPRWKARVVRVMARFSHKWIPPIIRLHFDGLMFLGGVHV